MKGLELDLNELFDIEGFIVFIILVISTFFVYYSVTFPSLSSLHEENVSEPVNVTVLASPIQSTTSCKMNSTEITAGDNATPKTKTPTEGSKLQLKLFLRVPRFVASFNDTTMELVIENPSMETQKGRFYIDDEIESSDGKNNHLTFLVDGQNTNQSEFTLPGCSRQIFYIKLNAPRTIEQKTVKFRLGLLKCDGETPCKPYGRQRFFSWNINTSCASLEPISTPTETTTLTPTITSTPISEDPSSENKISSDYICLKIDSSKAIQYSAREQILLSPWSNVFLPVLIFVITYAVDHVFPRRSQSRKNPQKFQLNRFWKLFFISGGLIVLVLFLLIKADIIRTIIIFPSIILFIVIAHTPCINRKVISGIKKIQDFPSIKKLNVFLKKIFKFNSKSVDTAIIGMPKYSDLLIIKNLLAIDFETLHINFKVEDLNTLSNHAKEFCIKRHACECCDEPVSSEDYSNLVKQINEKVYPILADLLCKLNKRQRLELVSSLLMLDPDNEVYKYFYNDLVFEITKGSEQEFPNPDST